MLLVEQNANLALEIAHRVYLLETGTIVASGSSEEISARRQHPQGLPGVLTHGTLPPVLLRRPLVGSGVRAARPRPGRGLPRHRPPELRARRDGDVRHVPRLADVPTRGASPCGWRRSSAWASGSSWGRSPRWRSSDPSGDDRRSPCSWSRSRLFLALNSLAVDDLGRAAAGDHAQPVPERADRLRPHLRRRLALQGDGDAAGRAGAHRAAVPVVRQDQVRSGDAGGGEQPRLGPAGRHARRHDADGVVGHRRRARRARAARSSPATTGR